MQATMNNVFSKCWPLVNQMQVVSMLVMVQGDSPANTQAITNSFSGVVNFEIIPAATVNKWLGFGSGSSTATNSSRRLQAADIVEGPLTEEETAQEA